MTMKTPVHPGEILREDVLADLGLSVGEAASRLGISRVTLSRVLNGHARISPNLAVRLEEAGVSTARAWLALQSAHDLAAERAAGIPTVITLNAETLSHDFLGASLVLTHLGEPQRPATVLSGHMDEPCLTLKTLRRIAQQAAPRL